MGLGRVLAASLAVLLAATTAAANSTFSPLRPPSIPLAVRSPYVSTWLDGDSGGLLPGSWPHFWTAKTIGWQGFVRVDNVTYNWMGAAAGPSTVTQTAFRYTSTKSVFTFDVAGQITLTATFLSPVYPNDLLRQSLQFSYLHVSAVSADGSAHDVQIYSDTSGEWACSDSAQVINWEHDTSNGVSYHQFSLATQSVFTETSDMAEWGTWFYATSDTSGLTYRTGESDTSTRTQFASSGTLDNEENTTYRAIDSSWPVFAFAQDLGSVDDSTQEVLYVVGLAQEEVVYFQGNSTSAEALAGLWTTEYGSAADAMVAFFDDYETAAAEAATLDAQIQSDAVATDGGQDYASLASLTVRQAFGGLQVAHSSSDGGKDYLFLKEISSDGDVQTVDVIFPAHPILLYLNATLVKLLLDPLLENQESGHYPNAWSIHDLGVFPLATGWPDGNDEAMPVEECGNMIIMALAYAQRSGDDAYLAQHWPLLDQWAQFLVEDALVPASQLSTDDFAGTLANQTNLALKGIIGIRAMSEIANRSGRADARDAVDTYQATADAYIAQWQTYAIAADAVPPHTTLAYGHNDTHGVLYNLYADRLLGLGLVPQSVYDMQSVFYPSVLDTYGLPLDTRHSWAKADWQLFAAAVAGSDTQAQILAALVAFVQATQTDRPLTDLYDATTAGYPDGITFVARPVMGGAFALLALP